jgi:transaldolase
MANQDINFSIWADYIERDFLLNDFQGMIDAGTVTGATSNPAIFKNAFLNSNAYESQKKELAELKGKALYEALAITDIQMAADMLRPLYDAGNDGLVSLEIDPFFAEDIGESIQEGMSLFERIDRPNVMIKVPATSAGYEVMKTLMSKGIHVNATLIFSLDQAQKVIQAIRAAHAPKGTKSVISVFVSRFDRVIDDMVPSDLQRVAGVFNASKIYNEIEAQNIDGLKCLFASTGVKDKTKYDESYYIEQLIGNNVVNTAPLDTIAAYKKSASTQVTLPRDNTELDNYFASLAEKEIDFSQIAKELLDAGLSQFKDAFSDIMKELEK